MRGSDFQKHEINEKLNFPFKNLCNNNKWNTVRKFIRLSNMKS
jgi:hypothetical protein